MDLAEMGYAHLFLWTLLVPLMGLDGARGSCPTPCRCSLEILNCSRTTDQPGFHQVPLPNPPSPPPPPFTYLDFTGNEISSVGKEVWKTYPWAEHLILRDNSLSRLRNTSLEGLLSLIYLDLSCNKIQTIEKNAFEAVPFLQIINLSGNDIQQIPYGTFRAWHGLQFLLKVDLSHNPLAVIQDSHFYRLPSLKFVDLGATEITPTVLEDLLQTTLQLKTLILPPKMSCGLCCVKEDIEALCETVKMECTESCAATLCNKEQPLHRMLEEVMKVLEVRKMNGSGLLNILPERAMLPNNPPERDKPSEDMLALAKMHSILAANFNLLESVKQLMQEKADEPLDVNWADKGDLKRLYLLASLLQDSLKRRLLGLERDSLEANLQNELSPEASKISTDKAATASTEAFLKKERHVRKVMRENWSGTHQRQSDSLVSGGQEVAETAQQTADQPSAFEWHITAGSLTEPVKGLDSQDAFPFLRLHRAALQSSWKRRVMPRGVDNNDNHLTSFSNDGNPVAVSRNGFGAHGLMKEELLHQLLHRNDPPARDGRSKISASNPEASLNMLSPDIKLSGRIDWEHQSTPVSPPLYFLAQKDDDFAQRELLEAELNKKLTSLIPNTPVRKLISHIIRILEMDCSARTIQKVCAKLISRTGLLMKLLSERGKAKATSPLWKIYFWPSETVSQTTAESARNLEKPLAITSSQRVPEHAQRKKMVLALSVAAVLMVIIIVISLYELCFAHSSAKDQALLGRGKRPLPDEEVCRTGSWLLAKPPSPLKEIQQPSNEIQKQTVDRIHYEGSSVGEEMLSQGSARPSLPKAIVEKIYPAPSVTTLAAPGGAPPPSTHSSKLSVKKSSGTVATASQAASSRASSVAQEDEEEEEEEESEVPTTVASSEMAETEEEEEEDED